MHCHWLTLICTLLNPISKHTCAVTLGMKVTHLHAHTQTHTHTLTARRAMSRIPAFSSWKRRVEEKRLVIWEEDVGSDCGSGEERVLLGGPRTSSFAGQRWALGGLAGGPVWLGWWEGFVALERRRATACCKKDYYPAFPHTHTHTHTYECFRVWRDTDSEMLG